MAILETDVIGWYDVDEGSGTTLDNAEGTATYDATTVGSPSWTTGGPTNLPNALDFNGTSQYIDTNVPSSGGLGVGDFTFMGWIRFDSTSFANIFNDWQSSRSTLCRISSGNLEFYSGSGTSTLSGNSALAFTDTSAYHFITFTYAASTKTQSISVDNGSFTSVNHTGTKGTSTNDLYIGSRPPAAGDFLDGKVAQAIILSKTVNATERDSVYNSGAGETYANYFSSASAPTVTTQAVTAIAETTATGNGNVTAAGSETVTARGVCWDTATAPTTADSTATAAGTTGAYTASITGLTTGTLYYVRAYATNSVGTSYGAEVTFTTDAVPAAFVAGDWTLTDLTTGGNARIAIATLPSDNGAAITDLEVKVGAAAYASLSGTTTGNYDVAGFTDGSATNVLIRAVNAVGNGADSDTKSVTTTNAAYVPADTDVMYVLDVSVTTNSPEGEFRPVTLDDLKTYFNAA